MNTYYLLFRMLSVLFLLTVFMLNPETLQAQETATLKKEAAKAYRKGDYENAEKAYQKIPDAKKEAGTSYNLGNALIRQNKNEAAVSAYDQALAHAKADKEVQFRAHYNKGNALFHQKKFKEAAESFKQALRMQPNDRDTRNNLSLTLQYLKQQQQEQQRQEGDKNTSNPQDPQQKNNTPPQEGKNNTPSPPQPPREGEHANNTPPQKQPKGDAPPKDQPASAKQESDQLLRMIDKEDGRVSTKMQQKPKARNAPKGKDW